MHQHNREYEIGFYKSIYLFKRDRATVEFDNSLPEINSEYKLSPPS